MTREIKLTSGETVTVKRSFDPPTGGSKRYVGGGSFLRNMRKALAIPSIQSKSYLSKEAVLVLSMIY